MAFGRLERSQSAAPMSEINVTPLVDVMLVLVVILIITAPLLASSIKLDLPRSSSSRAGETPRALTLVVDRAGQVFLADQPVGTDELARQLRQAAQANPETELRLRADQQVPYGRIVDVMGLAQQAGLNRIGFVTEPGRAPAKP